LSVESFKSTDAPAHLTSRRNPARLLTDSLGARRRRSKVTNGTQVFIHGDGSSPWARRWRDLCELHVHDIEPRGPEHLTEAQRSLIKRASTIEVELEQIEGELSMGKPSKLSTYAAASGHLKRILETLGIQRVPRDALLDPLEYAREREVAP
jgi:hypothetical protein